MTNKILLATIFCLGTLTAASASDLTIVVSGIRNGTGAIGGGIFNTEASFPKAPQALASFRFRAAQGNITVTFHNLPPGKYAASAYHDENDNGELDRDQVGIPKEGYGFSNDAKGAFGPPEFSAAAIELADQPKSATIKLGY